MAPSDLTSYALVLDLDSTLIDSAPWPPGSERDGDPTPTWVMAPQPAHRDTVPEAVWVRPGALAFLAAAHAEFGLLCVWTASPKWRALPILNLLFDAAKTRLPPPHLLRFLCHTTVLCDRGGTTVHKRLHKLWRRGAWRRAGFTRHTTLLLDDSPDVAAHNWGNLVPIDRYDAFAAARDRDRDKDRDRDDDALARALTAFRRHLGATGASVRTMAMHTWARRSVSPK